MSSIWSNIRRLLRSLGYRVSKITSTGHKTDNINHLARLPVELRAMIFRELLIVNDIENIKRDGTYFRTGTAIIGTAIMRTCRAFHAETAPVLYGKNVICLRSNNVHPPIPLRLSYRTLVRKVFILLDLCKYDETVFSEVFHFLAQPDLRLKQLTFILPDWIDRFRRSISKRQERFELFYDALIRIKQVQEFRIWLFSPIFPQGTVQKLTESFLSGEGPPERRIHFFVRLETLQRYEADRGVFSRPSPHWKFGWAQATDLALCEKGMERYYR